MSASLDPGVLERLLEFTLVSSYRSDLVALADYLAELLVDLGAARVAVALRGGDGIRVRAVRGADATGLAEVDTADPGLHAAGWTAVVPIAVEGGTAGAVLLGAPLRHADVVTERIALLAGLALGRFERDFTDDVTGLLNRAGIEERLARSMELDPAARWRVVLWDLARFRRVNEVLGFEAGDAVLREVARRLVDRADGCALARLGSDRFAALLPEPAEPLGADRFATLLDAPIALEEDSLWFAAATGTAVGDAGGLDPRTAARMLLQAADLATRANRTGARRSRPADSRESLRMDAALHVAVAEGRIESHFQPLYDLRTGELDGFEALARWTDPALGSVPPTEFIALAEENGLIHLLGDQIVQRAAGLLRRKPDDDGIRVQINVSTQQIAIPGYAAAFAATFVGRPQDLGRITLEVTESDLIRDQAAVEREVGQLIAWGVRISMDDFGTGYSSLSRLGQLPVAQLKIDRSFVQQAVGDGVGVLEAIIRLGRVSGLEVVAEGVETQAQLELLLRLDCDRAQGFLFSPALAEDVLASAPASIEHLLHAA